MRAGKMDRPITIQQRGTTRGESGGEREGWSNFAQCFAEVKWDSGGESDVTHKRSAKQTVYFEIHWRPGVIPTMRVIYEGQTYDITDVQPIGRHEGLRLTAYALEVRSAST